MTADNDAAARKAARKKVFRQPDIRMQSNGAAETRALMHCTPKGEAFVRGFAAKRPGFPHEEEGTYVCHEILLPVEELNASGLKLAGGIGITADHDMSWPCNLFRGR